MNYNENFKGIKSGGSSMSNQSNGGIMGSGIFGHIGTTIMCKAEDNSAYCTFMKFMNVVIMGLLLLGIIYLVYYFFFRGKNKGKR